VDHIVAVEDSAVVRRLIEISLESLDVSVVTVANGTDACEYVVTTPPDLLLLDIGLPDMDGWDVLDFVLEQPSLDGLPVIMLTGHTDGDDRIRANERGVAAYLPKPFRPADLRDVVTSVLGDLATTGV
jgi:CheY-like chemotaxis protein